jgi:hypothetical protein
VKTKVAAEELVDSVAEAGDHDPRTSEESHGLGAATQAVIVTGCEVLVVGRRMA